MFCPVKLDDLPSLEGASFLYEGKAAREGDPLVGSYPFGTVTSNPCDFTLVTMAQLVRQARIPSRAQGYRG